MNRKNYNPSLFIALTLLVVGFLSTPLLAQQIKRVPSTKQVPTVRKEIERTEVTQKEAYPQTISVQQGNTQVVHDSAFYQAEITRLEDQIKAIDQKISQVQSDPVADAEAKKNGWYNQMNQTKQQLFNQCQTYKAQLK
jgi:hypothetical protein